MITNPQDHLPVPTTNSSSIHNFKPPFIIHKIQAFESHPHDLQKRYYKYIHNLTLKLNKKSFFFKKIPMPKTLHSLNLSSWRPGQNLPLVKKLVKPYRKSLRNIQGGANHPKIQKLLPLLTDLEVSPTKDNLRILSLHPRVKKLRFDIASERLRKMGEKELLKKCKAPLSRNIAKIKDLTTISMTITSQDVQAAKFLLEIIDKNAPLDSLQGFSLSFAPGMFPYSFPKFLKTNLNNVLEKVTHLSFDHFAWSYALISSGKLTNLSSLKLQLTSWDVKDAFHFHELKKLKDFSLNLLVRYLADETNFFKNFSLPSSLEDFSLTLNGFRLSLINDNAVLLEKFLKRFQEPKDLKTLNLTIVENTSNAEQLFKFACLLIKCFGSLETLALTNSQENSNIYKEEGADDTLNFQDFWTAITPSKETLKSISVYVRNNEVIFPEEITAIETDFPRLQKLLLGESVFSAAQLGRFCQKIPSLREIYLKGVNLTGEEKVRMFLDGMKEVPEGADFTLHLDVWRMRQKDLIDCLKEYIENLNVKGWLGIFFSGVRVKDEQASEEISKLGREKGLELFIMTDTIYLVSKNKFSLR